MIELNLSLEDFQNVIGYYTHLDRKQLSLAKIEYVSLTYTCFGAA